MWLVLALSRYTVEHLLLHWETASVLWNSIFGLFGIEWVMPQRVIDWLVGGGNLVDIIIYKCRRVLCLA
jgi:hypothetical protein